MAPVQHERVLIIGSDPAYAGEIARGLREHGHSVEVRHDPEEAVRVFHEIEPTAVVTDMRETFEGVTLVRGIRESVGDVPILVLGDPTHPAAFEALYGLGRIWYLRRGAEWEHFKTTFDTMMARVEAGGVAL